MLKLLLGTFSLLLLIISRSSLLWHKICASLFILSFLSIIYIYNPLLSWSVINLTFSVDALSAPLIALTCWISALMLLASYKIYYSNMYSLQFSLFVVLLMLILLLTFMSNSVILFYILFEASLIPTLLLILGWGYQPERLQAGLYLMMYTIIASLPLLISLMWMAKLNSHISFLLPMKSLLNLNCWTTSIWLFFTIAAFLVKMPLFTVHLWLPKAHVEAPVAGSMVLAGVLLKLGSFGLLRIVSFFPMYLSVFTAPLCSIALWGGVVTSLICLRQTDMKSLIAYSSVGHMGLLTAGTLSNSTWGWNGSLGMMVAHGLCSSGLFALANLTYDASNSRSLFLSKGLMLSFPSMTFWWFLLSSANMAAPPSLNLLSEILLLSSALKVSTVLTVLIGLMAFLAGAYSMFLFTSTQHGNPPNYFLMAQLTKPRNFTMLALHWVPLNILILKPEVLISWV